MNDRSWIERKLKGVYFIKTIEIKKLNSQFTTMDTMRLIHQYHFPRKKCLCDYKKKVFSMKVSLLKRVGFYKILVFCFMSLNDIML